MAAIASSWQRAYAAASAFVIAFAMTYILVDYAKVPRLFYHQREHVWRWESSGGGPLPSGYVGQWLWALVVGALVASVAHVFTSKLGQRLVGLLCAWTLTALALAVGYVAWANWP